MQNDIKNKKKFTVTPNILQFSTDHTRQKIIIKNTSLKTDTYEIINPNCQHYQIQSVRKFTLAPGMSKTCYFNHTQCQNCHQADFNKLRITGSDKQTILVDLKCPKVQQKQIKLIQLTQQINFGQFTIQSEKKIQVNIKNISQCNLKLSLFVQNHDPSLFNLDFQQTDFILLTNRQTTVNGVIRFKLGMQFDIVICVKITSQKDLSFGKKMEKIHLKGEALVKNQIIKNSHGKNIQIINIKVLNGTSSKGEFFIQNNYRKDCKFKLIPEIHSTTPNQFAQRWLQSEIKFSQDEGNINSHQMKKIVYDINTNLNNNDINFIQKFSRTDFNDEFNLSKMKLGKYFKKNIQINVKAIFTQPNKLDQSGKHTYYFKIRVVIINPALRINYKNQMNRQTFQIINQSQIPIPFDIPSQPLYKIQPSKGTILEDEKVILNFEWKQSHRPKSSLKRQTITFPLAYGKCNLYLGLPKFNLLIFNFVQRQNLRPITSNLKKNLGLQKNASFSSLKRPLSALCSEMTAKKLNLIREEDFYKEIPRFLNIQQLKNQDLQKVVISSSQKGNIISNTWDKQISIYFPQKGHLILKPLKTYLLPFQLNLTQFIINDQQFAVHSPISQGLNARFFNEKGKQIEYSLSTKQLLFNFNPNKKQYEVENYIGITNLSKQNIKAFLLTIDDQFFSSLQTDNRITIRPQQTISFRLKFFPNSPIKKQTKIIRKLQFLINGHKQYIICYGQLLPISCDYLPRQLKFIDSHYGQDEVTQNIILSNTGSNKLSYQIICPQYVTINHSQITGNLTGKGSATVTVKFTPTVYLQNYKDHIKVIIRGSHVIYIPLLINTKKPDVFIHENVLDFGEGILGDYLQSKITVQNRNKTSSSCLINLQNTIISFIDDSLTKQFYLTPFEKKIITVKTKVTQVGAIKKKIHKDIAQIPGFGSISNPMNCIYKGKQNILQISPSQSYHSLNIQQMQQSFKIKIRSLINDKIELRTQLIPQQKYSDTFILSVQPSNWQLCGYGQKQFTLNSLISDLQKLTEEQRNYTLKIYRKGYIKPYTSMKFNIKLPTPKLIIQPSLIYFPLIGTNQWNHAVFRIVNKGYKQIHFKLKKPSNINFELETKTTILGSMNNNNTFQNKLTKLNNQAEVRVSIRSKNPVGFQNHIIIEDNIGNSYQIKFYGLITNCPLLLTDCPNSAPISAKSIPSMTSMPAVKTNSSISNSRNGRRQQDQQQQIEHAKFFNSWIGTFMPHLKKEASFHQFLNRPQILLTFLEYFSISLTKTFGKEKPKLKDIIFQLRKLQIPLEIVNIEDLQSCRLSQWNRFMFIFLSKKYINSECLKWISKLLNQNIETFDFIYSNYKKHLVDILNSIFFKVFNSRINQFDRIVQKLDPFLGFLYKINLKKQLILSLNMLYYKFANAQSQTITTEQLTQTVKIDHNLLYEKTMNWIISDSTPQILSVTGGGTLHTNLSGHGYYFNLDKSHTQAQLKIGLKQKTCIAIINSTIFERCYFINYDLQQIKPKIHNVVIQCQDKFSQQWVLDYEAPIDSQYKIQFTGDPQFKSRFTTLGLVKTGKKIPITITYSPNNLNPHTGTLTILNKHFTQIFLIKGKALFSQNIDYEKQIRLVEGKKHIQTIQLPWQCLQNNNLTQNESKKQDKQQTSKLNKEIIKQNIQSNLTLIEYNQKRPELISHNLSIQKHSKKQNLVKLKLEYLFNEPIKKLSLLYQITNDDYTQSKIIRIVVKVIPKPIHIEAEVKCRLEKSIIQRIPIQNNSNIKQTVNIQFYRNNQQSDKYERIKDKLTHQEQSNDHKESPATGSSVRIDNQFKLNKTGKIFVEPDQIQHIQLTYKPDSLYGSTCQIKVTFEQSQNVIHYKFKGIPQFPSLYQDLLQVQCIAQQICTFKIPLKSVVRQPTVFQVQTNIKQISGKQKVHLANNQTLDYQLKFFSYHPGTFKGQILFSSAEMTMIYPIMITVDKNPNIANNYKVSSKVRTPTILQLELHNKSNTDITYDVICDHHYLICPQKFLIQKLSKKVLEITYLPYQVGEYTAQIKLYHPQMKQIIYQLSMTAQQYQQIIQGPILNLLQPYTFVLPIKNKTNKDCMIQKPSLPLQLSFRHQHYQFPLNLAAGKSIKFQLYFKQSTLLNYFQQKIIVKTDCIGQYIFICKLNFNNTRTNQPFNIHYQTKKNQCKFTLPYLIPFINDFNQKLSFNISIQGMDTKLISSIELKNNRQITLQSYQKTNFQGSVQINTPNLQKQMFNISSNDDIQSPICILAQCMKNKQKYQFVFPIKLIRVYDGIKKIVIKANAYEMRKTQVSLSIIKDVSSWNVSDLDQDFVKAGFSFISCNSYENYLQTIINKPLKYQGFITFYNIKNQAEKVSLSIQIGQPKFQPIIISSNVGQKSILQVQLKNGKGSFKISLTNNKQNQFDVQPKTGQFQLNRFDGDYVAKINFIYHPIDYSGIKRAKIVVSSEQGCYYFNLMGRFKNLKKTN